VLIAIPDESAQRNLFALEVPRLGSFIAIVVAIPVYLVVDGFDLDVGRQGPARR
jgi:hypothetical protein